MAALRQASDARGLPVGGEIALGEETEATPPPCARCELAALTIASTRCAVMSPSTNSIVGSDTKRDYPLSPRGCLIAGVTLHLAPNLLGCMNHETLPSMFERLNREARQAIDLAEEEARSLKQNYIGTEHLLLGVLREEAGLGGRVLAELGVSVEPARREVVRFVGGADEKPPREKLRFTPRSKRVLELAQKESVWQGLDHAGTEHILLGLQRDGEGVAIHVLQSLGVDPEKLRKEIVSRLGVPHPQRARTAQVSFAPDTIYVNLGSDVRGVMGRAAARALDEGRATLHLRDVIQVLLRDEDAAQMLSALGVDVEAVRAAMSEEPEEGGAPAGGS